MSVIAVKPETKISRLSIGSYAGGLRHRGERGESDQKGWVAGGRLVVLLKSVSCKLFPKLFEFCK